MSLRARDANAAKFEGAKTLKIAKLDASDATRVSELIREHAEYERASLPFGAPKDVALAQAMHDNWIALWVATDEEGHDVGYSAFTFEYSIFHGGRLGHLEALFVRDGWRGSGIGLQLFQSVAKYAAKRGCAELRWLTPAWNLEAHRFYLARGAQSDEKLRYTLSTGAPA